MSGAFDGFYIWVRVESGYVDAFHALDVGQAEMQASKSVCSELCLQVSTASEWENVTVKCDVLDVWTVWSRSSHLVEI